MFNKLRKYKREYSPGRFLFTEGQIGKETFILLSGELEVIKGNKIVNTIKQSGSFFGEISALLGIARTASVKTKTKAEILIIPDCDFQKIIGEHPEIGHKLAKVLAKRLVDTTSKFVELKCKIDDHDIYFKEH
ncbi:MAG: hypothetical protein C0601_07185 [Candidatus Muiribacterium halophilum]|uniref:Cyclic nucleotide-binding domain-containing protein n=1 Tax=Muiribacterium halophilum TaxID=2053465 RepID=A0A2N5ZFY8_MUIH1|nr:MAG: hypothetical protein C0601_07185 [Candidatus Muirbacterium halophilum]